MSIEKLKRAERVDEERMETLNKLFPEAFTDGKINFELLKEEVLMLSEEGAFENAEEYFTLNWTGKKEAKRLSFLPSEGTLKYVPGEGINEEKTENVLIEGDNLEVLRILQKSYSKKVKCIYIDPPYNTGSDFVYKDDFRDSIDKYLQVSGQSDEDGMLTSNPKAGGRYHSNWLNLMYPRLKLARNLLKDDGLIFISIDDNEQANLKLLMDEIFGGENFLAQVVWQKIHSLKNDAKYMSNNHEYILIYAKQIEDVEINLLERTEEMDMRYKNPDNDPRGPWQSGDLVANEHRKDGNYEVKGPTGKVYTVPYDKHWVYSKESMNKMIEENRVYFGKDGTAFPRKKRFLSDVQDGRKPETLWLAKDVGHNQEAKREIRKIFDDMMTPFDTPKPIRLIERILKIATNEKDNDLVLDFFAGSGTTGQAVLDLNKKDQGNRRFMLVQIPESIDHDSFSKISDVTIERLKRCIVKDSNTKGIDGFKVYKLDKSNLKKWDLNNENNNIGNLEQAINLFTESPFQDSVKELDFIIELMLHQGFKLDSNIEKIEIGNNLLWVVQHSEVPFSLIFCLEDKISDDTADSMISMFENSTFVCLDDSLTNTQKILLSEVMNVKTI